MKNLTLKSLFVMIMATFLSVAFIMTTYAATSSNGTKTQTITVVTKANWLYPGGESITLSQTKGVRTTTKVFSGKTKTSKCYGKWKVVAKATDGSHTLNETLSGSSLKLSLKRNKTYKITVSWDSGADIIASTSKGNFTTLPTWRVKSTYKCSSCY